MTRTWHSYKSLERLTPKEREVLGLLRLGQPTLGIGARLGIERSTVQRHIAAMMLKSQVHSRAELLKALEKE